MVSVVSVLDIFPHRCRGIKRVLYTMDRDLKNTWDFQRDFFSMLQQTLTLGTNTHSWTLEDLEGQDHHHRAVYRFLKNGWRKFAKQTVSKLAKFVSLSFRNESAPLQLSFPSSPWENDKAWHQAFEGAHWGLTIDSTAAWVYVYPPDKDNCLSYLWVNFTQEEMPEHRYTGDVLAFGFQGQENEYDVISGSLHLYDLLAIQIGLAPRLDPEWDLSKAICLTREHFSVPCTTIEKATV